MPPPKKPLNCIVAVMMTSDTMGAPFSFLGTAFFIDDSGTFLTACHVFDNNPLPAGRAYAIAVSRADPELHRVADLRYSREYDIAIGRAEGVSPEEFLTLADADASMNRDILTVEFSPSTSRLDSKGVRYLELSHGFHKGYVTSYRTSHL